MSDGLSVQNRQTDEVIKQREQQYGGFSNVSKFSQAFKDVLKDLPNYDKMTPEQKEGFSMMLHKLSRYGCSPVPVKDTLTDMIGYLVLILEHETE